MTQLSSATGKRVDTGDDIRRRRAAHGRHPRGVDEALAELNEAQLARIGRIADPLLSGQPMGQRGHYRHRARSGVGLEILDYREYTPGDDFRRVDWRQSARLTRPHIRRYHDETASDWFVCLDRSASMAVPDASKWLLAVQLAAAVVYLLLRRRHRVGLVIFSEAVDAVCPPSGGRGQFGEVLSLLRVTEPRHSGGASRVDACIAAVGKRCSVFVVGDLLAVDGMLPGLERLALLGGDVHALQVLCADECALPGNGKYLLKDVESAEQLAVDLIPGTVDGATKRLDALCRTLAAACPRRGIAYTRCTTAWSWHQAIVQHLNKLYRIHA